MFLTTYRIGDVFELTDAHGHTVAVIALRQRKGQNQIGIDAPGLKISKQQKPQDEEKQNDRLSATLGK